MTAFLLLRILLDLPNRHWFPIGIVVTASPNAPLLFGPMRPDKSGLALKFYLLDKFR